MNKEKRLKYTFWLVLCTYVVLLEGCASRSSLHVDRLVQFKPQSKTVELLTTTRFDNKLRVALAKRGFTVLKFASNKTIIREGEGKEIAEIYKQSEAVYGISFNYNIIDTCLVNDTVMMNATLELADVAKNEVVFVIERGGATGPCGFHSGKRTIFDDLADAVAHEWENSK